jgi:hypothetical protein
MSAGPRGQYQAAYVRGEHMDLVAEASAGILGQLQVESIGAAARTG